MTTPRRARSVGKGRRSGSFKRASGAQVGKIAVKVRTCRGCELQLPPGDKATKQCPRCGRMDFVSFDSTGEARRWAELLLLQGAGHISGLRRQVSFDLRTFRPAGTGGDVMAVRVARYVADFVYIENGRQVIEDYKGAMTDVAALKLRWMEAMGLPVKLTGG